MALRLYGRIYHAYFRDENGKLRTISTHESDKSAALKYEKNLRAIVKSKKTRLALMRFLPEDMQQSAQHVFMESEVVSIGKRNRLKLDEMFELAGRYRKLSDDHRKKWNFFLNHIKKKYADEITSKIARDYLQQYFGNGNGKNYNNNLTALNTIFRLCIVDAGIDRSPFSDLPRMRVTDVQHYRPLTEKEFLRAFSVSNIRWKSLSLIAWHTGQRFETCVRILRMLSESDYESITILPGKTARFGRAVFIPLHSQLRSWFKDMRAQFSTEEMMSWSFTTKKSRDDTKNYYSQLLSELGIVDNSEGKASFHSLRSSFITRCDEFNVSREATKGIVGQVDDDTTDLYSHDRESAKQILELPAVAICM